MAREAYVKISEQLIDAPALASVATPFLVAGVIKSSYGAFDIKYFTSRKKFLETYTVDGKLTGSCDVSLVNAYELMGSAPILVCRASALNYTPFKIDSLDDNNRVLFSIKFKDFMCDGKHIVRYNMKKSEDYPGAVSLNVVYESVITMYKYTLSGITDGGNGYRSGDVIIFTSGSVSIKARILAVDDSGAITELKLLTYIGSSSLTSLSSEGGATISVTSEALPNEVNKSYEVIFSLDDRVVDNRGISLFYKNVWSDEYPFEVVLGPATPTEVTVPNPYVADDPTQPDVLSYLDYGPSSEITGTTNTTIAGQSTVVADEVADPSGRHWDSFRLFEDRQIPIFIDFGTPNIGTYLKPLANQFNAMYCNSLPLTMESYNAALTWNDLDLGNSRRYACTPFAQTTNLGFVAYIAPTSQYIETVVNNMLMGKEFEAVAGKNTGVAKYSTLTKFYDKGERENLLDLKINTISYKDSDGFAMFNDDLTGLVINNPFKEEFNRRLGVRIAQDIDTLLQQFKFKINTPAMRSRVESTINNYFDTSSFKDKIAAYEVICNDDNNPPYLQAQNKLAVVVNIAFYYTSKYIEVLNKIYSVGQSFNENA
jgi:hypothetical protein